MQPYIMSISFIINFVAKVTPTNYIDTPVIQLTLQDMRTGNYNPQL